MEQNEIGRASAGTLLGHGTKDRGSSMHLKTLDRQVTLQRQAHRRRTVRTLIHAATCNGPGAVKRIRERLIRHELDHLACSVLRSQRTAPEDFDGREALYMRASVLRRQLEALYTECDGSAVSSWSWAATA